jgi:V8-like Glu-specific endopeptidase
MVFLFSILNFVLATEFNPVLLKDEHLPIHSIAAMVSDERLNKTTTGYEPKYQTLVERNFCPTSLFAQDQTLSRCSGALITNKHILTAGHCFHYIQKACESHYWVFDYVEGVKSFTKDQVYKCKTVVAQNYSEKYVTADYAIIELDREVEGRETLKIASDFKKKIGTSIYSLSYPLGKPMHLSNSATINKNKDVTDDVYFWTNLITMNGSSGAPVMTDDHKIVGIIATGSEVVKMNTENNCKEMVDLWHDFPQSELDVLTGNTDINHLLKIFKRKKIPVSF